MLTNLMKRVFKMYVTIYKRLVFYQFTRIAFTHLIDNHIVQRKLPSLRQLDKLRHFGFGLYNWALVGQKGVQT